MAFVANAPAGVPALDMRFLGFTETCARLGLSVEDSALIYKTSGRSVVETGAYTL